MSDLNQRGSEVTLGRSSHNICKKHRSKPCIVSIVIAPGTQKLILWSTYSNLKLESKPTNSGLTHFQKLPISVRNHKESINKFKIELMKFIENKCLYSENYIHWYYLFKTKKEFQPDNFLPSSPQPSTKLALKTKIVEYCTFIQNLRVTMI